MGKGWIMPASVFAILPAISLARAIAYRDWIIGGWMLAALAGSVGAGLRLAAFPSVGAAAVCDVSAHRRRDGDRPDDRPRAMAEMDRPLLPQLALRDFLLYFPACFVLEEVSFRGRSMPISTGPANGSA